MKKLIVAPHVDDEVLGCGGILDHDCLVVHCGLAEDQNHGENNFSKKERLSEWRKVEEATGCRSALYDHPVNNFVYGSVLINDIEVIVNAFKPDMAFIPSPSYNQDHQAVYKACITALRPHDINHFVKKIVMYEQPQDLWNGSELGIKPNYFVPISIEKKIKLYEMLESQVRGHRSPEMLKTLAKLRGYQSDTDFAEAFEIIRWVE